MSEIKWGTKGLSQGYRYEAKIVSMEWVENDYGRKQLEVALSTKDGQQRKLFIPYSNAIDSKWGVFQKGLESSGVPVDLATIDEPEKWLEGKTFLFEQYKKVIKVLDSDTGEHVEKEVQFTKPIKYLSDSVGHTEYVDNAKLKQQPLPSQDTNKPIEERFIDILKTGDKSVESMPELLGTDFGNAIEVMNSLVTKGLIKVNKGGILHLIEQS